MNTEGVVESRGAEFVLRFHFQSHDSVNERLFSLGFDSLFALVLLVVVVVVVPHQFLSDSTLLLPPPPPPCFTLRDVSSPECRVP